MGAGLRARVPTLRGWGKIEGEERGARHKAHNTHSIETYMQAPAAQSGRAAGRRCKKNRKRSAEEVGGGIESDAWGHAHASAEKD